MRLSIGLSVLLGLCCSALAAQTVVIRDIHVDGNKKTKRWVISREMTIQRGDTLEVDEMQDIFLLNENHLLNTNLFISVHVSAPDYTEGDQWTDIQVDLRETWYFFPIPVLKLSDRNFNVWWEDYDADLERLIYGIRLQHYNLTGARDYLKATVELGWAQRYHLQYRFPYLNRSKTWGLEIKTAYHRSRNGQYDTNSDRQVFLINEEPNNFKGFSFNASIQYRQRYYTQHKLNIGFRSDAISAEILDLNPSYYIKNRRHQRFFSLLYEFSKDRRDRNKLATKGHAIKIRAKQTGLGFYDDVNYGFLSAQYRLFVPLYPKITGRFSIKGRWLFNRKNLPYNHSSALGYAGDYIRGYEHYVIDGTDYIYSHQAVVWHFLDHQFNLNIPIRKLKVIPLRMGLSAGIDLGYVKAPLYTNNNELHDRWNYGYGAGLEVVIAESIYFTVHYSRNHREEDGVYLHSRFNF